jgi:hypothetical protein
VTLSAVVLAPAEKLTVLLGWVGAVPFGLFFERDQVIDWLPV